jgi:transposase
MSNVLSEEKKQQVIALGKLGWPLRRIEQATGVRRETAGAYLKAAGIGVRLPGAWGKRAPAKPANEVTPDPGPAKPAIGVTPDFIAPFSEKQGAPNDPSPPSASVCEAYRELIEQGLARGRNGKAIWQDLVSDQGFAGSYQAVKRFVRKLRGPQLPEAAGIILTAPGEEAQVDYGSGPMVRDAQSGKFRRTRLFVMTLGFSRKSVRLLAWRSSSRLWAELHEKAFRRLGGCCRVVVLDNLREGVLVPDIYEPTVNPLFRDVLAHYGVVALPCRIQDPDRKGKVESGIGHTKKTPLKGMRFESEAAYYGLPPGWIGRPVKVQWDELHVRILHPSTSQLLREHLRQKRGGYRIQEEDHPKKMPFSTAQLLRRAEHAGAGIGKLCQLIYQQQGETGIRRILGMLSLMKKYGAAAVEDACATALDIGVHQYRFVRRYLERRPHPQMFLRQIDPLIRELTEYRDFINLKIKEQPE